jgi:hypothetical protein
LSAWKDIYGRHFIAVQDDKSKNRELAGQKNGLRATGKAAKVRLET